uniref:NAD(P)-binding protein n=1 Tax=Meloidogyne hapla TaxID=6305 RepID=A0A1I8BI61_MELHA
MDLQGKAVVVIGATTGFGHQFVIKCASKGMTVFAACNSPNGVQKVVQATSHLSGFVHAHSLDLSSTESIERFFRQVINQLPPGTGIHALINNAGIIRAGADDWLAMEDYEHVLRVNLLGLIQITKLFKEHIKLAKLVNFYGNSEGRIIFCSSICGRLAFPYYGPYTVSKFAMEGYCDTIRLELVGLIFKKIFSRELSPFGVKVAVVEPGYFRTPITNPDHIPSEMEKSFNKSSQYIKDQYGQNFIQKTKGIAKNHLSSAANSPHVEWVIDVYFHACTALFPRKRYVVGIDANFVVIPISRLPTELQDLAFWLNSLILKNPIPKILHNGGCLNAKMVHRWIKNSNGFVAYLEGEEKESSLNSSGYWEFNQNSEREEDK